METITTLARVDRIRRFAASNQATSAIKYRLGRYLFNVVLCFALFCGALTALLSQTGIASAESRSQDIVVPENAAEAQGHTANARADTSAKPKAEQASTSHAEPNAYRLGFGDLVKLTIFGRPDLSAEYRISEDGQLRVPQLGSFDVEMRTAAEVESRIRDVLDDLVGRKTFVTLDVIERRPIFVVGLVGKPGAYPHRSGMLVIHAMALAGGIYRPGNGLFPGAEISREKVKLDEVTEELIRLNATRSRLLSEEQGKSVVVATPELLSLTDERRAAALIEFETALLKKQIEVAERTRASLKATVEHDKNEIDALLSQLKSIKEQRELRVKQLDEIQKVSEARFVTLQRLTDLQIAVSLVDNQIQDVIAALSRANGNFEKSKKELELLELQRASNIAAELIDIDQKIAKAQLNIRGTRQIIEQMAGLPPGTLVNEPGASVSFEILRSASNGKVEVLKVSEVTPLLPGDVLRVNARTLSQSGI